MPLTLVGTLKRRGFEKEKSYYIPSVCVVVVVSRHGFSSSSSLLLHLFFPGDNSIWWGGAPMRSKGFPWSIKLYFTFSLVCVRASQVYTKFVIALPPSPLLTISNFGTRRSSSYRISFNTCPSLSVAFSHSDKHGVIMTSYFYKPKEQKRRK